MNIATEISRLGLAQGDYIVIGSGILDALGIRQSQDLDLVVSVEKFDKLRQSGKWKIIDRGTYIGLAQPGIEVFTHWNSTSNRPNLSELLNDSVTINGVTYCNLQLVRAWKSSHARKKDLEDIKLIDIYLTRQ